MKLTINKKEYIYDNDITLLELSKKHAQNALYGLVNKRVRELTYIVKKDATIEFEGLNSVVGEIIHRATLTYIFNMALYRLNKTFVPTIRSSVCRTMYVKLDKKYIPKLKSIMDEIIKSDLPITRMRVSKEEALKIYEEFNYIGKKDLLKYRTQKEVNLYKCDEYINYMYSYMLPSTSYIINYKLIEYKDGVVIQYPGMGLNGKLYDFHDEELYFNTLEKSYSYACENNIKYIHQLNDLISSSNKEDITTKADNKLKASINELIDDISLRLDKTKLIAIAGPTSSGKTTFCMMLEEGLNKHGVETLGISIDNFYRGINQAPIDEFGNYDYEHIDALDVSLFDQTMSDLVNYKPVRLPTYNFKTGVHTFSQPITLKKNQVIVIEGIHALNKKLTEHIPNEKKYKIFISPLQQVFIDEQNQIRTSDIRLIRRIVRDKDHRNSSATQTLDMWSSVRRGEFTWIYPCQENADFVFSSELLYELPVIKNRIIKLLDEIKENDPNFITANRLKKFLKLFKSIDESYVKEDSLLREFIGGSKYHNN